MAQLLTLCALTCGCQIGYIMDSAYHQVRLLNRREPIEEALQSSHLSAEQKNKLRLAVKAKDFAETHLHLKKTKNYTSFVQLDEPYVTYVVSAAPKDRLEHHLWRYPLVGSLPYKGFFSRAPAEEEAKKLQAKGLDTFVRGVSAYSTLGWFADPVLSSMLNYSEPDLVNTIIHESVHATIYIRSEADFNERLATFLGNKGAELFYLQHEGPDSPTLQRVQIDAQHERVFSEFISREINDLTQWYEKQPAPIDDDLRQKRLQEIQKRFALHVRPVIGAHMYRGFEQTPLNNARLLAFKMYMQDLSDFEKLYEQTGRDFSKLLTYCKSLESAEDPQKSLKQKVGTQP